MILDDYPVTSSIRCIKVNEIGDMTVKECDGCEFLKFNSMTNEPICMKDAYTPLNKEKVDDKKIEIPDGCILVEKNGVLVPVKIVGN